MATSPAPWLRIDSLALASGLAALATAIIWWGIVFWTVVSSGYLSFGNSVVCLGQSSATCDLAMAICKASHFLDIRWYSPLLFWFAVADLSLAALLTSKHGHQS